MRGLSPMSIAQGFQFLGRSLLEKHAAVERSEVEIPIGGEKIPAYRFVPSGKSRGVVCLIHGMAVRGYRDPRVDNMGRTFASLGFTLIAPEFSEISGLRMIADSVDRVSRAAQRISEEEGRSVALFSASFSGAVSIVAACGSIKNRISAVCTIGTSGSIDTTAEYLMGQQGIDDYGRMIALWNFVPLPEPVREALRIAIVDNGLSRNPPELPAYLSGLKQEDRDLFQRLRTDRDFRLDRWHTAAADKPFQTVRAAMSPVLHVKKVPFPVFLIHGKEDRVIPPSESEILHKKFQELGTASHLCVTPLISHGDGSLGVRDAMHLFSLASAFGKFFDAI